jgi:Gas vesicle synthesis protein GvpL/GvpF
MKVYLYCVTDANPNLSDDLNGLDDQIVEVINNRSLFVVASKFESEAVAVSRENVLQHEAIVRKAFSTTTVLPFRFGTLVTETGLETYLKARESSLLDRLEQVRDCVEMSVKIIWQNSSEIEDSGCAVPNLDGAGAGTAFLVLKRQELLGNDRVEQEARELEAWLGAGLRDIVRQEQITIEPKQRLVFSASYLVERARLTDYRRELGRLQAERTDLHFLSSGPWPPYTFANIDLEFGTHFGVS